MNVLSWLRLAGGELHGHDASVLVGALLSDTLRYTLASTIIIVLGVVLGFRPTGGVLGVLLAIALLRVFFCGPASVCACGPRSR